MASAMPGRQTCLASRRRRGRCGLKMRACQEAAAGGRVEIFAENTTRFLTGTQASVSFSYMAKRSSYMISSSPRTFPQSRSGSVHFFVASVVAKYNAFNRAVSLGNTLLLRFKRL